VRPDDVEAAGFTGRNAKKKDILGIAGDAFRGVRTVDGPSVLRSEWDRAFKGAGGKGGLSEESVAGIFRSHKLNRIGFWLQLLKA
jgi:hypothetical protein